VGGGVRVSGAALVGGDGMSYELHHGDCLEVMATLPDGCADSIVTDPPYGLSGGSSKSIADRLGDIVFDVMLPDLYNANVSLGRLGEFCGPLDSITFLDFMNGAIGEETRVAVPESAVDFQSRIVVKQEVENCGECSVGGTDWNLAPESNSLPSEFCCDFIFQPRYNRDAPISYSRSGLFRQLGPGRFCVTIVIARNSQFARFLSSLCPCGEGFLADVIRFCNDAESFPLRTSGIMTSRGAELRAVLSFDLRSATLELLPADGTRESCFSFQILPAQPVRARAGAGGLPAKFKARSFGLVGNSANRTLTFHFHKEILTAMQFTRKGFMGKEWDGEVPSVDIWREVYRVLKPGGHLLAFAGTRTQHRMALNIEEAGFELRDICAWIYGSGFPKSLNLDGEYEGWGTALKPAMELITIARKPFSGTVLENVQTYGTGALNIDGCRIETDARPLRIKTQALPSDGVYGEGLNGSRADGNTNLGRWPANVIHDGSAEVLAGFPETMPAKAAMRGIAQRHDVVSPLTARPKEGTDSMRGHNDSGGSAARFFYCAKADKADRDEGLQGFTPLEARPLGISNWEGQTNGSGQTMGPSSPRRNHHPTVKPCDLMRYLCRLVTPTGGTVFDPFMGSGSTGKAAMLEGFNFIGIEREAEYIDIARARIEAAAAQLMLF
jgi:site-specific DNA-methyltransferase (adenine-specific)